MGQSKRLARGSPESLRRRARVARPRNPEAGPTTPARVDPRGSQPIGRVRAGRRVRRTAEGAARSIDRTGRLRVRHQDAGAGPGLWAPEGSCGGKRLW